MNVKKQTGLVWLKENSITGEEMVLFDKGMSDQEHEPVLDLT